MQNDNLLSVQGAFSGYSADEVLAFLKEYDRLNEDDVLERMKEKERKNLINNRHPYKIWKASDGRWKTYIEDDSCAHNRKLVVKGSERKLEEFLVAHYQLMSEAERRRQYTLRNLYPEWLSYKGLHSNAKTYIVIRQIIRG